MMKAFIVSIIERFGGRYFGSEAEKNAQYFVQEHLKEHTDTCEVEVFQSALEGHFQALKIFVVGFFITLIALPYMPLFSLIFGCLLSFLFIMHFVTYRHWLDFLFPKKPSYNVIGNIEPSGEVKQTLIFAGHIDSVKEFKWWFRWKDLGVGLTVVASFLLALFFIFICLIYFFDGSLLAKILWISLWVLSPSLWVLFDMHGKEVVHGANDNLTGVAMSVAMAEHFYVNRPQHTRIRVISFGAEEAGLRGAFAYARKYKESLLADKALLVNLDTIKDKEYLTIATNELNTLSFFDKQHIANMKASFDACSVPVKLLPLTVGASDASAFIIEGLPALSLIGMTTERLDPTYHTRLDNVNHLNDEAMLALKEVLIHFVGERDKKI